MIDSPERQFDKTCCGVLAQQQLRLQRLTMQITDLMATENSVGLDRAVTMRKKITNWLAAHT